MKVLLLASGKSYHATRWANSLADRGIKVAFASVHKVERPISNKVEIFQLSERGLAGYLLDVKSLRVVLKKWQPDVLHAHYATGYGLMSKLSGFKNRIVSIYGADIYDFPRKSALHRYLLSFNLSGTSRVLSTSESMANEYFRIYPKASRPVVTPFGVNVEHFKPNISMKNNQGAFNIGIVKKLEDKYGIDVLINAFKVLQDLLPSSSLHLHIVGVGSGMKELTELSKSLGLQHLVTFYGEIQNSDVPTFLNEMDIFVVPSRNESESFGVAAVEAQACGLPVVVADVGGLPEVVANNQTGIVVPKENPDALANAMKVLYQDDSYRHSLGVAGRERVLKFYDWQKNVAHMVDIYRVTVKDQL